MIQERLSIIADGCILTEIDGYTFLVCYYMFV